MVFELHIPGLNVKYCLNSREFAIELQIDLYKDFSIFSGFGDARRKFLGDIAKHGPPDNLMEVLVIFSKN